MSSVSVLTLILYSFILVLYFAASLAQQEFHSIDKGDDAFLQTIDKYKLFYFTGWTFIIQVVFLTTALLDELSKLFDSPRLLPIQKLLGRTRACLFNIFVFPCSLLVSTIFWGIWHYDRELIIPRAVDEFYPLWVNHTMHTFTLLPLVIELALPKKHSFVKSKNAAVVLTLYLLFYICVYMSVYIQHGVWLYRIHGVLSWPQRALFIFSQWVLCVFYQKTGIEVQNLKRIKRARKTD